MYCKYCGKEIDGDSAFCRFCGKSQKAGAGIRTEELDQKTLPLRERWEFCKICCENLTHNRFGKTEMRFYATTAGANGTYIAARSRTFVNPTSFPSSVDRTTARALKELLDDLRSMGWEELQIEGEHWYSHGFRRGINSPVFGIGIE